MLVNFSGSTVWKGLFFGPEFSRVEAPVFGSEGVLKIFLQSLTWLISNWGICRTTPATPGLLITYLLLNMNKLLYFPLLLLTRLLCCSGLLRHWPLPASSTFEGGGAGVELAWRWRWSGRVQTLAHFLSFILWVTTLLGPMSTTCKWVYGKRHFFDIEFEAFDH